MAELTDGAVGDIMDRHAAVMGPVIDFDTDIEIVSSEGSWVTRRTASRMLDFSTGISVSNLGHQPPAVKQAMHRPAGQGVALGHGVPLRQPGERR